MTSGQMDLVQNHTKVDGGLGNAMNQTSTAFTSLMVKIQLNQAISKECIGSMNQTPWSP